MSNSQDQSLDENVVFFPVDESSPAFLHCEREREAVERLLIAGPEAFYSYVGNERSGCFLSPGEVSQISSWAQNYHFNHQQGQAENGVESASEMEEFCSTYFPHQSDMPTPHLELGWPERGPWVQKGKVMVHTSPPAEGEPPVREVIRQHLQKASQVIAIVTDRLTDGAIIGDLHTAASRGVPIYIILNQRSIQENFTLNRLRHPNMRVRVLGGKTFCTRTGQMVVGEMKDQFLMVDLETVIHGSYSLTWTDAHLHRQLITVLTGPVVDSFDQEFRILYAASLHVPDTWRAAGSDGNASRQLKDNSDSRFLKTLSLEPEITSPPSPPADFLLDWEAMGVVHNDTKPPKSPLNQHEEILFQETQLPGNKPFDRNTYIKDGLTNNGNAPFERKRIYENTSPVMPIVPDKCISFKKMEPVETEPASPERMKKIERTIEQAITKQLSNENTTNSHEIHPARFDNKEQTHVLSPTKRRSRRELLLEEARSSSEDNLKVENTPSSQVSNTRDDGHNTWLETTHVLSPTKRRSRRELLLEEARSSSEDNLKVENTPSSRKPVILRLHQSESFSSLSDIMKRLQQSSTGVLRRAPQSEKTKSMMDLSIHTTDLHNNKGGAPVPRFRGNFDSEPLTPALALMKKRNDELKSALYRVPKTFMPSERPRSSSYQPMDWRRSLAEGNEEQE